MSSEESISRLLDWPKIESIGLSLVTQWWDISSNPESSKRMKPRRWFWPNPAADSNQTQPPEASSFLHRRGGESFIVFASSWRRKLHHFCIVAAARHVRSLRFVSPEAFVGWVWLESAPGFHSLLLSSSFWTLWVAGNISPLRY